MPAKKILILPSNSRWKIIKEAGKNKRGNIMYYVQCSCILKTKKIVNKSKLRSGHSLSCGCLIKEMASKRFKKYPVLPSNSRWKIIKEVGRDKGQAVMYEVECSCEQKTRKIVQGSTMTRGKSLSCGCLVKEVVSNLFKKDPVLPPNSRWKIIRENAPLIGQKKHGVHYEVECSCEQKTRKIISYAQLNNGKRLSCGCLVRENGRKRAKILILPPNSRWKIISETQKNGKISYNVECKCPLKTKKVVIKYYLTSGTSLSCGCIKKEQNKIYRHLNVKLNEIIEEFGYKDLTKSIIRIEENLQEKNF